VVSLAIFASMLAIRLKGGNAQLAVGRESQGCSMASAAVENRSGYLDQYVGSR
jgi:hypothetical protein